MSNATLSAIRIDLNKSAWTFYAKHDDQCAVMCDGCATSHGWQVGRGEGSAYAVDRCDQDLRCEGCGR